MSLKKKIKTALVGNPNCGKTTLFNQLTGLRQKVGNFPGVTVDKKTANITINDEEHILMDLPGTYSLSPKSMDEQIVQSVLLHGTSDYSPDQVIVVIDASNLKRNLYLLTQVMDLGLPVLMALNMTDISAAKGKKINIEKLSQALGIDIVAINASKGQGLDDLKQAIANHSFKSNTHFCEIPASTTGILEEIREDFPGLNDYQIFRIIGNIEYLDWMDSDLKGRIEKLLIDSDYSHAKAHLEEISLRYAQIQLLIDEVEASSSPSSSKEKTQETLDRVLLHPIWGTFIFLFIFFLIFQAVFSLAAYPMDWIDAGMGWLISTIQSTLPDSVFSDFLTNGILSGLAGVVIFIPQIMILFGLIALLEDSGYMSRVSFLNDKLLSKVGMNGKSIVPIVGGFACAVPAIMSARSISNQRDRLITIMITPLMSCSARLPVYVFLIAFIVPDELVFNIIHLQGLFMLGLYLLGVFASVAVAALLNKFLDKDERGAFMLELPTYKLPGIKNMISSMINKSKAFVLEAGKIILIVSMVLWVLASYGPGDNMQHAENAVITASTEKDVTPSELEIMIASERLKASYAGELGQFIEPAIRPLGFDWKTGIAIITSFAAREVFVGTMSTIYSVEGGSDSIAALQQRLMNQKDPQTGKPILGMASAFSLLIFYVFAMQCMSTVAIVKKETGVWKWAIIQFVLYTAMAYLGSLVVFQMLG